MKTQEDFAIEWRDDELAKIRPIIEALAEMSHIVECSDGDWCKFCCAHGPHREPITHEASCVWKRANDLLPW